MLPSCRHREPEAGKVKFFGQSHTVSVEPAWREENTASQACSCFSSQCRCSIACVLRRDVEGQYTLRHHPLQVSCGVLPAVFMVKLHVYLRICTHVCAHRHMQRLEDNSQEPVLPFCTHGSWGWNSGGEVWWQCHYPLSHLTSPMYSFKA